MKYAAEGKAVRAIGTTRHDGPEDTPCDFDYCVMSDQLEDPEAAAVELAEILNDFTK